MDPCQQCFDFVYQKYQNNWETLALGMDCLSLGRLESLPVWKGAAEVMLPVCGSAHRGQYLTLTDWVEHGYSKSSTDPKDRIVLTKIMPLLFKETKTLDVMFKCRHAVGRTLEAMSWVLIPRGFGREAAIQGVPSTIEITLTQIGKWRAAGSLQVIF
jgi:hypothetical protein